MAGDDSFLKPAGNRKQSFESYQVQVAMETEGRQFSDFYRNSSEELFLKSLMDTSVGMPVPTMEILSSEMGSLATASQQPGASLQKKKSNEVLPSQTNSIGGETSTDFNQNSMRTAVEKGLQASNLYLAKAWFQSSQPMTRSRSSELRKRYAAMQNAQTSLGMEAAVNPYGNSSLKEELSDINPNDLNQRLAGGKFMSPSSNSNSNSSSSPFNAAQTQAGNNNNNVDKVSSVVSMLKGTLERKKLGNQIEKEDTCIIIIPNHNHNHNNTQEEEEEGNLNQFHEIEIPTSFPDVVQAGSMDLDLEGFVNPTNGNAIQMGADSQSESSAAAPSGFDACDGPTNSGQTLSMCESSKKHNNNNGSKSNDFRERIIDNLKDDRKRGGLVRYGSVTSTGSVERTDPTKKRRVERSRKMAEAKERNSTPPIPSDMQAVLKRCETLEKEVRSLKLNLSFMNRKDSEQTKQIEELQKQNQELTDEKERLLEEIERIIADSGNM
ncbi:hypothetical protein CCACVL1_07917 [Corchorus capsularis]|uniref:Protein CYCLOPS n=1 Tax=Corchorus capsularis TaxID=210143 RepID=A0A1R3J3A4_COCAP|nr:hypothetical protein CCACVL1_07917 [Corchorus capsularis]